MQNHDLQTMTVVQLRKLAREQGIKLSAGIDKEGIVERLSAEMGDPGVSDFLGDDTREKLQSAPLSADVTMVAPASSPHPWEQRKEQEKQDIASSTYQPVFRQAWQARPSAQRQPVRQPSWQMQRSNGSPTRFGPQINFTQAASAATVSQVPEDNRPAAEAPKQESSPRLDGYRLGYQAAPQRQGHHRQDSIRGEYRSAYRSEQGYARGSYSPTYPSNHSPVEYYNDALYKPVRDPAFAEPYDRSKPVPDLLHAGEPHPAGGVLEILPDGYGFLRADTLLPGKSDIYVSVAQIRRYNLRTGDYVEGMARPQRDSDKFAALLYVERLNDGEPEERMNRQTFDSLIPIYPNRRIVLESEQNSDNMSIRLVDLIAPIGFGQRAMIIAPPESGRISMLKEIGKAIKLNDPQTHVSMLMVDAAPEEVTEIREALDVEVFASTFTETPESQTRVSETMLESAQRLVEDGRNVVILLDSLTKLTRAYQSVLTQSGRALTNTVTPAALVRPKRFFGMARNTREGGSLTIIATIAVETGSRADDIIFEEFKGTANMELRLCVPAPGDPIFPLIDLHLSGTKKEDTLLSEQEKEGLRAIRTVLGSTTNREAVIQLVDMMHKTKCNADLFNRLKDWMAMWEKSGFLSRKN